PDPDLLPLEVSEPWLAEVQARLPELPNTRRERFINEYGITPYDAAVLTATRDVADYFETAAEGAGSLAKLCSNWITGMLSARLNETAADISQSPVRARQLRRLVERIADGTISSNLAREVFDAIWAGEEVGDDAADAVIH